MAASGQASNPPAAAVVNECDLFAKLSASTKNLKEASNTVVQYSISLLQIMLANETRKQEFPVLVHRFYRHIEDFYSICVQTQQLLTLAATALNQSMISNEFTSLPIHDCLNIKAATPGGQTIGYTEYIATVREQVYRAQQIEGMLKKFTQEFGNV